LKAAFGGFLFWRQRGQAVLNTPFPRVWRQRGFLFLSLFCRRHRRFPVRLARLRSGLQPRLRCARRSRPVALSAQGCLSPVKQSRFNRKAVLSAMIPLWLKPRRAGCLPGLFSWALLAPLPAFPAKKNKACRVFGPTVCYDTATENAPDKRGGIFSAAVKGGIM